MSDKTQWPRNWPWVNSVLTHSLTTRFRLGRCSRSQRWFDVLQKVVVGSHINYFTAYPDFKARSIQGYHSFSMRIEKSLASSMILTNWVNFPSSNWLTSTEVVSLRKKGPVKVCRISCCCDDGLFHSGLGTPITHGLGHSSSSRQTRTLEIFN